jgi:hypothetical protein
LHVQPWSFPLSAVISQRPQAVSSIGIDIVTFYRGKRQLPYHQAFFAARFPKLATFRKTPGGPSVTYGLGWIVISLPPSDSAVAND